MLCYRDTTFCASPNCKNQCGRKLTDFDRKRAEEAKLYIMCAYFCGEPEKVNYNPNESTKL